MRVFTAQGPVQCIIMKDRFTTNVLQKDCSISLSSQRFAPPSVILYYTDRASQSLYSTQQVFNNTRCSNIFNNLLCFAFQWTLNYDKQSITFKYKFVICWAVEVSYYTTLYIMKVNANFNKIKNIKRNKFIGFPRSIPHDWETL